MARYRSSRKSRRVKWIIILCVLIALIAGLWLFFRSNINPVVIHMSESTVKAITTTAVNEAVYDTMADGVKYSDLIEVKTDNDGKITMLQANSVKINEIARNIERTAQQNLQNNQDAVIYIPMGAFTGSPLLADTGPKMDVKILPVGSVTAKFVSEFEEAGINQTRHKIYLDVASAVNLVIPFSSTAVHTNTQVLIAESVLVGSVPEVYLKFQGGGGQLNLVPSK